MANEQVVSQSADNSQTTEPAKDTVLTGDKNSTTSLTGGTTPQLPHAWMSGLTSEQKANADLIKSLSQFEKGIPDLVKVYAEAQSKRGQTLAIPNEKATEEEKAQFQKAINKFVGVPEKIEDYKLERVKLPKGLDPDEAMEKAFLETAFKANLTPAQVQTIQSWYETTVAKQIEGVMKKAGKLVTDSEEQCNEALRKEFGEDYDKMDTYRKRAYSEFFDDEAATLFVKSGLGNSVAINRGFMKMGKAISEHPFADGSRGSHMETKPFGHRTEEDLGPILYPDKGSK